MLYQNNIVVPWRLTIYIRWEASGLPLWETGCWTRSALEKTEVEKFGMIMKQGVAKAQSSDRFTASYTTPCCFYIDIFPCDNISRGIDTFEGHLCSSSVSSHLLTRLEQWNIGTSRHSLVYNCIFEPSLNDWELSLYILVAQPGYNFGPFWIDWMEIDNRNQEGIYSLRT